MVVSGYNLSCDVELAAQTGEESLQDPDKGWELHFAWLGALLGITATGFYSSGMGCNGGVAEAGRRRPCPLLSSYVSSLTSYKSLIKKM